MAGTQNYLKARGFNALASAQGYPPAKEHQKELLAKIELECPLLEEHVEITGTSRDDLNGQTGMASSFDHAQGRYAVHLDEKVGTKKTKNCKKGLLLKPGNLKLVVAADEQQDKASSGKSEKKVRACV